MSATDDSIVIVAGDDGRLKANKDLLYAVQNAGAIHEHISARVEEGVHDFPVVQGQEDAGKLLLVDATGNNLIWVYPNQLGLIEVIGPNPPFIFHPGNRSSVETPVLIDFVATNVLSSGVGSIRATIYHYDIETFTQGQSVWTTNWISNRTQIRVPFGLLNVNQWYVIKMDARDFSGALSESSYRVFRLITLSNPNVKTWDISLESMIDMVDLTMSDYILINRPVMQDTNLLRMAPNTPVITNMSAWNYYPIVWEGRDFFRETIELVPYQSMDNIPHRWTFLRFKNPEGSFENIHRIPPASYIPTGETLPTKTLAAADWQDIRQSVDYEVDLRFVDELFGSSSIQQKIMVRIEPLIWLRHWFLSDIDNVVFTNSDSTAMLNVDLDTNTAAYDTTKVAMGPSAPAITNLGTINYKPAWTAHQFNWRLYVDFIYNHPDGVPLKHMTVWVVRLSDGARVVEKFYPYTTPGQLRLEWVESVPSTLYEVRVWATDDNNQLTESSQEIKLQTLDPIRPMPGTGDVVFDRMKMLQSGTLVLERDLITNENDQWATGA